MADVSNTIETIEDLQTLLCDGIEAIKNIKDPFKVLKAIAKLTADVQDLMAEMPEVMPELSEVDAEEVGELSKAAYELVVSVIACLKGHG